MSKKRENLQKAINKLEVLDDWLAAAFSKKYIMKENEYIEFGKELNEVIGLLKSVHEVLEEKK